MSIKNIITFEDLNIKMAGTKEQPLFCGPDVCTVLGIANHRSSMRHFDSQDFAYVVSTGTKGKRKVKYVTESGLYRLIFQSRKKEAINFQLWVTREVLPTIRKYGCYPKPEQQQTIDIKHPLYITNEKQLHYKVIDFIRKHCKELLFTASLGELQDTSDKRLEAYSKGYLKGSPDIMIFDKSKSYNSFVIELKSPQGTGKLSDVQINTLDKFKQKGSKVLISNDYDDIVLQIKEYYDDIYYVKRLRCEQCDKTYANSSTLTKHIKSKHV